MKSTTEMLPEQRPWEYDCDGNKTHKGDYTRLWTDQDEQKFLEENFDFDSYGGGVEDFSTPSTLKRS